MSAPADSVYRAMTCGEWRKLKPASQLALRVFLELFYGDDSERTGVMVVRPSVLCDELKSSKRAILAALAELVSIGVIEYDENAAIAGRVGFIPANLPKPRNNAKGWLDSLPKGRDSVIVAQAAAFIESKISQREPHGGPRSKSRSEPQSEPQSESPQDHRTTGPQDQSPDGDSSLTLTSPSAPATESKPKKPSKPKAAPKPFAPPTHDEVAQRLRDKGLDKPTASFEATAFIEYWDASDWKGVTNWRKNLATWLTNWRRRNPVQQPRDFTSRWTVQPGQAPDPYGGCRE